MTATGGNTQIYAGMETLIKRVLKYDNQFQHIGIDKELNNFKDKFQI
jgi:hypothetical protein